MGAGSLLGLRVGGWVGGDCGAFLAYGWVGGQGRGSLLGLWVCDCVYCGAFLAYGWVGGGGGLGSLNGPCVYVCVCVCAPLCVCAGGAYLAHGVGA